MTRPVYVTADVHLDGRPEQPARQGFLRFLAAAAAEAEALYILGDLFDYWVGPAQLRRPGFRTAVAALAAAARKIPVHVLPGNRDFALGGEVGGRPGLTLHEEFLELAWAGRRVLLTHGDALLEGDRAYQRLRRFLRTPLVRGLVRRLPGAVSLPLAARLRSRSRRAVARKDAAVFRLSPRAVGRLFRGGVDVIVCGHVHRAAVRRGEVAGRPRLLVTLGAWGLRGWVVRLEPTGGIVLTSFPPGETPRPEPLEAEM